MAETLFSLEVHVDSVENLRVACKLPALCFRLLDFPTMIIHHVSPLDAEKMRQKLRLEGNESVLHDLKDRFGNFQFRKGKSCLFKASIDTLLVQLQTVPLYAMLMDLWPKKPVLVGSTLIPLKKAIDKISKDVYQKGVAVPSFYRDEGVFNVYNLMGSCIAKVKLGFRLLSLGGSLIPHIPTEALAKRSTERIETGGQVEQAVKGALEKVLPEIESGSFLEEEIAEDTADSKTDGQTVKPTQTQEVKQNVEVQTNLHARDIKNTQIFPHNRRRSEEELVITNTFCPPPLYYNCFSNSTPDSDSKPVKKREHRIQMPGDSSVASNTQTVDRDTESRDVDFMYFEPSVVQVDGTAGVTSVSVQTDEKLPKPSMGPHSNGSQMELVGGLYNLGRLISDGHLPVLNALIQELSSLTGGRQTNAAQLSSSRSHAQTTPRHPQKYSNREKDPRARKPLPSEKNAVHIMPSQHVSHPKRNQTSVIGLPNRRVRFKQTNLTYGMTKTQQMRLELNQKDKVINRRRPCEAHAAALAQKENKRGSLQETLGKGGLGMTYKIGSARKQLGRRTKQMADAQIQTQELSSEQGLHEVEKTQQHSKDVKENREEPDVELAESDERSTVKTPNSVEVFIPQVEVAEPEEKSDQEGEWSTDQPPVRGLFGHTGIISSEYDNRGGSAMTMYTEDFEESEAEGSQRSLHLDFTRSNSADHENLKPSSDHSDSSGSAHSQSSSLSSQKPVKSSKSPVKTKSRRRKTRIEVSERVERKITISEDELDIAVDQARPLERRSSGESRDPKEDSDGNYTDDFHSAGSELENSRDASDVASVDSSDAEQYAGVLDLPPPANNLGYTC